MKAAAEAHPNRRNPRVKMGAYYEPKQGTCAYTGLRGSHCIAGQALVDLGLDVPKVGERLNTVGFHGLYEERLQDVMTREAAAYLNEAQSVFDGEGRNSGSPKWSAAYKRFMDLMESQHSDAQAEAERDLETWMTSS